MTATRKKGAVVLVWGMLAGVMGGCRKPPAEGLAGTVNLSGAWALYPMALKWAEEFQKLHPHVRVDVQAGGAGKGVADVLSGMVDLGMVSRDIRPEELEKGAFPVAVTKDAVVPTASAANPYLRDLLAKGVSREVFAEIWTGKKAVSWGRVLGLPSSDSVHVFTRSDACGAAETWAAYLGGRQEDLGGVGVYGDPGLAEAVRRDALGVGYNNVNFAYDAQSLRPVEGLAIIPIDLDGDGAVGPDESFYRTRDDITAAIARGAYPSPPARELFLVAKGKPARPPVVEFLKWVLTDGQAFVQATGYIRLAPERAAEGLSSIGR